MKTNVYDSDETLLEPKLVVDRMLLIPGDIIHQLLNGAGYDLPDDAIVSDVSAEFPIEEREYLVA